MSFKTEVELPEDVQDLFVKETIRNLYGIDNIFAHKGNIHREANKKYNNSGIFFSEEQISKSLERLVSHGEVKSEEKTFAGKPKTVYKIASEK